MNAIDMHLRDPINSGLTRWRMVVLLKLMDAAAEIGRNPVSKHHIHPEHRDEQADAGRTAEPLSRDKRFRRERGQINIHFPCSDDHE